MKNILPILILTLFAALATPQCVFAKRATKKKTVTVTVGADCGNGISLSVGASGNTLCASYPPNAIGMLRQHEGQSIQVEAVFEYPGAPKSTAPNGILRVTKVAGTKVYDPCSTSNSIIWGLAGRTGLPPGCAESLQTGDTTAGGEAPNPAAFPGSQDPSSIVYESCAWVWSSTASRGWHISVSPVLETTRGGSNCMAFGRWVVKNHPDMKSDYNPDSPNFGVGRSYGDGSPINDRDSATRAAAEDDRQAYIEKHRQDRSTEIEELEWTP